MSLCVASSLKIASYAVSLFTLTWSHSVEKVQWQEDWKIVNNKFEIVEARIKGSGAGMEPPEDSKLVSGWWVYKPKNIKQNEIILATSNTNIENWKLCLRGECFELPNNKNYFSHSNSLEFFFKRRKRNTFIL